MNKNSPSRETKMEPLLSYPYNAFLMVRLEFVQILQDDLQAKLLRIIEAHVENQRMALYREAVNSQKSDSGQSIEIPKDIFVPISYKLFMNDLFGLVTSENTIKKNLKVLIDYKIIFRKPAPNKKYAAPEYSINTTALQILLDALKIRGYQSLIPSILDTLKDSYPQDLIPSWYQKLIPSNPNSSSEEKSRVSQVDTTIREIEYYDDKKENIPNGIATNVASPIDPLVSLETATKQQLYARLNQLEQESPELEHLSTPPSTSVSNGTTSESQVEQASHQTQLPIATVTTGNAPIERNTEKLNPLGIYDEQEKQQHHWWCELGLAVKVNVTNKGHWATLSEHVHSFEDMKSLYEHTEQQIENDSSFQDKTVKPGNLANADNLNGWKKKKRRAEQPKDSSKPSSVSGMRNYTFDPEAQPATQEPPSGELVAVPGFSLKALREQRKKERMNA